MGEFEGEVGVRVRRHAAWEHGTAHGDTAGPGHGNLLVLLVARRGLGACHQSLPMRLEPLRSLVVCFIARRSIWGELVPRCEEYALWSLRRPRNMERVSSVVPIE